MFNLRSVHHVGSWVVYQMLNKDGTGGPRCVCEQAEWDAMERLHPNQHRMIQAGIENEGVAERLARGTSGDPLPRGHGKLVKPAITSTANQ